jgi:hypothetical protein
VCFRVLPWLLKWFHVSHLIYNALMPKLLFACPGTAGKLDPLINKNEGPTS